MPKNLLFELGTEEIPAGYLAPACEALRESFSGLLAGCALSIGSVLTTHTPRKIVLFAETVPERQPDRTDEVQGPPAKIAFDAKSKPTPAALGFARANGVNVDELTVREVGGGSYVFAVREVPGRATTDILAEAFPDLIAKIPFPKSMHWGGELSFTFARPIRSILCLFGSDLVGFEVNGVKSGRTSAGHPFLAEGPVEIPEADYEDYRRRLREKHVIVDVEQRKAEISDRIGVLLAEHGSRIEHFDLLDEVTNLVEWPCVIEGSFDEKFLSLPDEVTITALTEHQRYFPVRDADGKLVNRFITVSNRTETQSDRVRRGNERVLVARLDDAAFFWKEDRRTTLADKVAGLSAVTFQEKLGSFGDRTERLEDLAAFIARRTGQPEDVIAKAERVAHLSKADLVTHMVYEFPSLQGIMGREYALADGEDVEVARAIAEHYKPRSIGDDEPETLPGSIVALADKFDALVGCFAVGFIPTGSQDPYGLRRHTQGIGRIIMKQNFSLSLREVIRHTLSLLPKGADKGDEVACTEPVEVIEQVLSFIRDRLYQHFLDAGAPHELIRAALEPGFDDVTDFSRRLSSLVELSGTPDWNRLAVAVERTHNITRDFTPRGDVDEALLTEAEERRLFELYNKVRDRINELLENKDYLRVGQLYEETFAEPLHTFFEKVYVNVEDKAVRENRLTLLKLINRLYAERVADLSQVPRKEG